MRVDSHQHFWTLGQFPHSWITPALKAIHRSFGPTDLKPLLEQEKLDGCVLVQTFSSLEETRWFLSLASRHPFILGVVGWVDLTDSDVDDTLDALQAHPKFVGVRHVVHDEPDREWLLRREVLRGLAALEQRKIPYDLLIRPSHLAAALQVARLFPELSLIIDHMAKPRIEDGGWEDWAPGIAELARCDNVTCKLSGMITEAGHQTWKASDLKRYIEYALEQFTPKRLMYGSDWPVCLLAGSYRQVVKTLAENLPVLTPDESSMIWGNVAVRTYRLQQQ